ncbi:hypothetical protein [uncultured Bacteroides sp.]|uniref:hypothetical protein n=1 Tax=uncultured Bacteroides sp. TaxID=162156 RepID=UPI002602E6F3|nr:hypothetical protein [uncultured Bacteroides sp.]
MKLIEVLNAYNVLGEAKVSNLEDSEVLKIVKARKAMRPLVEEYEAFSKDVHDKFRYDGIEADDKVRMEVITKLNVDNSYKVTEEENEAIKRILDYIQKVENAKTEELGKEVNILIEKLDDTSLTKMIKDNGWELKKLDELGVML